MAGKTIKVMQEKMHELGWSAKGEEEGRGDVTEATLPGMSRGAWSKQRYLVATQRSLVVTSAMFQ